jgi:spermidine synthase
MTTGSLARRVGPTAFLMAFASMSYELLLAQSSTILYGGTVVRYSTIIGLFIFSLGMGAAHWAWSHRVPTASTFWRLELALAWLGIALPLVVFPMDALAREWLGASLAGVQVGYLAALLLTLAVGWLSGMELPVLLLLSEAHSADAGGGSLGRRLVGLDFLGTVAATVVVPLLGYPHLGIVGTASLASGLNGLLGWWVGGRHGGRSCVALRLSSALSVGVSLLLFCMRDEVGAWLASEAF